MLAYIENFPTFAAYCFVVRGMEALGASAYATASYVFVVDIFPENIGSVLVSIFVISVQIHPYLFLRFLKVQSKSDVANVRNEFMVSYACV